MFVDDSLIDPKFVFALFEPMLDALSFSPTFRKITIGIYWLSELWSLVGCWLDVLRINVDLAIFQPYLDFEAGDNQSLKIQVARPGIEPRSSCSASQELNHSTTVAPNFEISAGK